MRVTIPVSFGELVDKITILELKASKIRDLDAREHVEHELGLLRAAHATLVPANTAVEQATAELRAINQTLWDIEDELRECERRQNFGPAFVELARRVYKTNDMRSAVKRRLDVALGSEIREEKSYRPY